MPTTTVKTIKADGTGDYSTLQTWEAAAPANLVTADEIWQGQAYHTQGASADFTGDSLLVIAGSTSDSTRYKELTAAAGQSFQDNANVRTNRLDFIPANGVAISNTGDYNYMIDIGEDYARMSRLQLKSTGTLTAIPVRAQNAGLVIKDCIVRSDSAFFNGTSASFFINLTIIVTGNSGRLFNGLDGSATSSTIIGCTFMRTTDNAATGVGISMGNYSGTANIIQSCAIFGAAATTPVTAGKWDTTNSKNNGTSSTSGLPGSSNQHSITYSGTTPFTQASNTNTDIRAIAATTLIDNGFRDATNAPNDISATARDSTPTIGVWEVVAAAGSLIKTVNGLAIASVKTVNDLAIASVKTINGLTNV